GAAAALAGAALAAWASALVTRPSRPVPATEAGSTPFSDKILDAAGEATPAADDEAGAAGAAAFSAAGSALGAAAAGAAAASALAAVSILAISCPEVTVLPSPSTISASTPEAGAGTSSTTLSVSISMRISSASTAAPFCFFQVSRVASETDSDNWGTTTSVIAIVIGSSKDEFEAGRPYLVSTKPLCLDANACSMRAFCCSWCLAR